MTAVFFQYVGQAVTVLLSIALVVCCFTVVPDFFRKIRNYRHDEYKLAELRARITQLHARITALEVENEGLKRVGYRA